jgi:hypothetical protein
MVSRGSARYICLTAFPQTRTLVSGNHVGKFDITSLFAPQMNGRFRYDIRLYFSCEAHIESVRTYRARSAYRSPQANIDAHLRCAKSQFIKKSVHRGEPIFYYSFFSNLSTASRSSFLISRCWGQTDSHTPQPMHSDAFPPLPVCTE